MITVVTIHQAAHPSRIWQVKTRHASIHCCQFRVQYAHEKQYVKSEHGIPLCRWRGTLVADYRTDPCAKAAHGLVGDETALYVLTPIGGANPSLRVRHAPMTGGGDAKPPAVFSPLATAGAVPQLKEGFSLLHTKALPKSSKEGGEAEAPAAEEEGVVLDEDEDMGSLEVTRRSPAGPSVIMSSCHHIIMGDTPLACRLLVVPQTRLPTKPPVPTTRLSTTRHVPLPGAHLGCHLAPGWRGCGRRHSRRRLPVRPREAAMERRQRRHDLRVRRCGASQRQPAGV